VAVPVQVIYDPDGANLDISGDVLFHTARLESQISAQPGLWECVVKDVNRTHSFTTGKRVLWKLGGTTFYGGFLTQVESSFAFPTDDTTPLSSVKTRQFTLRGADYNLLFDKRVMRRTSNYLSAIPPHDRASDSSLITFGTATYIDVPSWLDYGTHLDTVANVPRTASSQFGWVTQGSPWRKQMDMIARISGAIYYIKANGNNADLHYHAQETSVAPYELSDAPTGAQKGFRELDALEDATGMVNDALVWGGNDFTVTGSTVVFARAENAGSISSHGRWQWAETHFGDINYATQDELDNRADVIVNGRTGDTIYEQNRGLQAVQENYRIAWHDRDVPKSGGAYQFIQCGDLTTLHLNVFGKTLVLPCRQLVITFPENDSAGDSYVRFEGMFGLQLNDPYTLWQAVAKVRSRTTS
jgi:hypothetical protein